MSARRERPAAARTRLARAASCTAVAVALAAALLAALATPEARAQSGRRQPGATPTPTPQRPRRAPSQDPPPGQPSTPDAPSTTTRPPSGQPSGEPAIEEDEVYQVESNLVPVSANVSDAAGRAVVDLKVEDFELRVDGQPKPISEVSFAETPVRLALLFDNSSSIRPTRELEKHAAAGFFRKVLRPVDQAAIFSIATYPTLDQQLTNDAVKLARTIESYGDMENSTALFDTVVMAAEYLQPMPGRKVIVIVSDGVETTSRVTDFGEVVRRVLAADCQVFVIQTGLSENANLRDLMAERRMQDLTASTGGAVFTPKAAADLEGAFTQISNDLRQQYVLSYYPTDDGRDGRFRAISLRVKTRPNMRVRARRGYYPRRRADNLSASAPQNLTAAGSAVNDAATHAPPDAAHASEAARLSEAPASSGAQQRPGQPQPAPNAVAPSLPRASGPVHGSKNMDLEASDGSARAETQAASSAPPAVRLGNFKPRPPDPAANDTAANANENANAAAETARPPRPDTPSQAQPETNDALRATRARTAATPDGRSEPSSQSSQQSSQPSSQPSPAAAQPREPESARERESAQPRESKSEQARGSESERPRESESARSGGTGAGESKRAESNGGQGGEQPARADAPARKIPVSGGVLNGRAISLPRPAYPEAAKRMRIAGTVAVEVVIDESGKVVSARATGGPALLREAAVAAARLARFSPTLVSGRPMQVAGVINYTFSL